MGKYTSRASLEHKNKKDFKIYKCSPLLVLLIKPELKEL